MKDELLERARAMANMMGSAVVVLYPPRQVGDIMPADDFHLVAARSVKIWYVCWPDGWMYRQGETRARMRKAA